VRLNGHAVFPLNIAIRLSAYGVLQVRFVMKRKVTGYSARLREKSK
jgi:hypothetical protein